MTIEKLPSGSYRIREQINKKRYSFTVDHRPSKYEAEQIIKQVMGYGKNSLKNACEMYIEAKEKVLSPSTIREYKRKVKQIDEELLKKKLVDISKQDLQEETNRYTVIHSAKSTHDYIGLIMSVFNYFDVDIKSPKLPQIEKNIVYIPTEEELTMIFNEIRGTEFEVPIVLASMGLRRGEICALGLDDLLEDNTLIINKALVQNDNKAWVIKTTKTTDSTRTIKLPKEIADTIRKQGYVYKGFPGSIYNHLQRVIKKLGIKHFSLHKLRHFYASYLHNLGYSDMQIQEMGGWKTNSVMKTVYQHGMEMEKTKNEVAGLYDGLLSRNNNTENDKK
jgi:integrase